ncbi:MAG TPA: hypothetical protein VKT31_04315 [Solirubrobacteraceae bacterium]|nr:hypothetical protein [Solirubrobacteraceae bacterium]
MIGIHEREPDGGLAAARERDVGPDDLEGSGGDERDRAAPAPGFRGCGDAQEQRRRAQER